MDLLRLPPDRLLNALTKAWMDWHVTDEDTWKVRYRLGRSLDEIGRVKPGASAEDTEAIDDMMANPFPGVMRGGPVGVIGQH